MTAAVAGCATQSPEPEQGPAIVRLDAEASGSTIGDIVAAGCATPSPEPEPSARVVRFEAKEGPWKLKDIFQHIHTTTGISISYDTGGSCTWPEAEVTICGVHVIEEDQLFDWLQAIVSYRRLVLVPVGPKGADGKKQWFLLDPLKGRPPYIDESKIGDYAEREHLYVVTTITLSFMSDTTLMRNALAPLSTAAGGVGRIRETPGESKLIVGDFAPVVAAIAKRAARLDIEFGMQNLVALWRAALMPPATLPVVPAAFPRR